MNPVDLVARHLEIPPAGVWVLLAVAGLLTFVTAARSIEYRRRREPEARKSLRRIVTWFALFVLLLGALGLGRGAMILVMIGVSLLGLREALHLTATPHLYPWGVALIVTIYGWAWLDWRSLFVVALPLLIGLLALAGLARRDGAGPDASGKWPDIGTVLFLAPIGPSYVIAVASLPVHATVPESRFGWVVLLLLLTGVNDSAQAWWGRWLGSRRLAPRLSPAKTWEGLWGGLVTTGLVATLAGPALAPVGRGGAAAIGLVVALAGVAGDLAASSLKRGAGVKDSGALVPGHGGVLDRFDSLAATAPVIFFLALAIRFRP